MGYAWGLALAGVLAATTADAADSTFRLDAGAVSAAGPLISILRLPVRLPNGRVVIRDATIVLRADSAGNLAVVAGYPKTEKSAAVSAGGFVAGDYAPAYDATYRMRLSGPSLGPGGRDQWILDRDGDDVSLRFYAGPIAGHPLEARITAAGATAPFSYGVVDGGRCDLGCGLKVGDLVALSAGPGGQIYLHDFTTNGGTDTGVPVRSLALRPCDAAGCG